MSPAIEALIGHVECNQWLGNSLICGKGFTGGDWQQHTLLDSSAGSEEDSATWQGLHVRFCRKVMAQ